MRLSVLLLLFKPSPNMIYIDSIQRNTVSTLELQVNTICHDNGCICLMSMARVTFIVNWVRLNGFKCFRFAKFPSFSIIQIRFSSPSSPSKVNMKGSGLMACAREQQQENKNSYI